MDRNTDTEVVEESSLEDAISDVFDELDSEEEVEEVEDAEVEEDSEEEEEAEAEEAEGEGEEEAEAVSDTEEIEYNEPAPERWPEEMREAYNEMSPQQKELMMERVFKPMQRSYVESTQELSQMRKTVAPMLESLKQNEQVFANMGLNPVEAFNNQMAWAAHFARVGNEQGIRDMQEAYGVKAGETGQEEEYLTPAERALREEVQQLKGQQHQFLTAAQQAQQEQQQQLMQQRASEVKQGLDAFENETKDGKPAHPHLERVAPSMTSLINSGLVSRTDEYGRARPITEIAAEAYDKAVALDPSLRAAQATTGQVKKAKAANRGVVTKIPVGDEVEEKSLVEDIEDLYDSLNRG